MYGNCYILCFWELAFFTKASDINQVWTSRRKSGSSGDHLSRSMVPLFPSQFIPEVIYPQRGVPSQAADIVESILQGDFALIYTCSARYPCFVDRHHFPPKRSLSWGSGRSLLAILVTSRRLILRNTQWRLSLSPQ